MNYTTSKKEFQEIINDSPLWWWFTPFYTDRLIYGRTFGFSYVGIMPYDRLEECAEEIKERVIYLISELDEFDGHWSIEDPTEEMTITIYLGGPGSGPPPD